MDKIKFALRVAEEFEQVVFADFDNELLGPMGEIMDKIMLEFFGLYSAEMGYSEIIEWLQEKNNV
jgi:hypothetical protein